MLPSSYPENFLKMSKKRVNSSSSDSDTSSDSDSDDSTYQKFKEIAVSADFIKKTASKAQNSNSQNREGTTNNQKTTSTKTNKIDHLQNFNGSGKFDNEIPAGFEKIVSEKIAAWLVEKLSNKYDFSTTLTKNSSFYENFQKDYHKRIKYGIRFLENGEKVGSKQMKLVEKGEENQTIKSCEESSQSLKNKRKSAGQLLNDKLKKKSGTKNESDVSACVVDFDYKRKKFS